MVMARRRSYEQGHRPKFLVFVDDTPECGRAVRFAARRVARLGAKLVMLAVSAPPESFEWLGVGDVMRAEAEEEATEQLEKAAVLAREAAGVEPERVFRVGKKQDEILKLIEEDEDIAFLVLAAGTSSEGPGPLVTNFAGVAASTFPLPVVIVPGSLTDEDIDALAG
ncbi:universal stress protein [Salinarimonas ramus]|uniref:Universal stress protein A n=1 Tax=Salinarimonas ramus TaxID=690164 RepID=A0A917QAN2_9HYPH|nr:universal stress protein A [Salinarimonas ramus]